MFPNVLFLDVNIVLGQAGPIGLYLIVISEGVTRLIGQWWLEKAEPSY